MPLTTKITMIAATNKPEMKVNSMILFFYLSMDNNIGHNYIARKNYISFIFEKRKSAMNEQILFSEKQRFKQWWIYLLLFGANRYFIFAVVKQIILKRFEKIINWNAEV